MEVRGRCDSVLMSRHVSSQSKERDSKSKPRGVTNSESHYLDSYGVQFLLGDSAKSCSILTCVGHNL